MSELVSVVAPAYKHEKYIEKCIKSIAEQDYPNKELIIIDDKSPDQTVRIIEDTLSQENIKQAFNGGITFIKHSKNQGAYSSINEGLAIAKGHYLTIINTDDLFEPNRFRLMTHEMELKSAEISFSKVDTIDGSSKILRNEEWHYYNELQQKVFKYPTINMALLTDNVAISTGNMMFTRRLYKEVGLFREYQYIHDWDFILRCSLITEPIYVEGTSYLYRLHETNSFKELQKDEELCWKESMEVLVNYCKRIKSRKFSNPCIPSTEVWQYFIQEILHNPDIAHIWRIS